MCGQGITAEGKIMIAFGILIFLLFLAGAVYLRRKERQTVLAEAAQAVEDQAPAAEVAQAAGVAQAAEANVPAFAPAFWAVGANAPAFGAPAFGAAGANAPAFGAWAARARVS